jgi:RNA polymerase sporulation-specific sigma factor
VELARRGDAAALQMLLYRHRNLIRGKAGCYFLAGADREDVLQEGMIGLFKAVRDFRPERHASFRAFAELCISRQLISAVKTAARRKHLPLNQYVSLSEPAPGGLDLVILPTGQADPAELLIDREDLEGLLLTMRASLSPLEARVIGLHLEERSYQEIAAALGCGVKSVDNALQRVKRKIEHHLHARTA